MKLSVVAGRQVIDGAGCVVAPQQAPGAELAGPFEVIAPVEHTSTEWDTHHLRSKL